MKPEEIKKGLELCRLDECFGTREGCPYNNDPSTCVGHMCDDVLAYIKQLEAQVPRWISVEERLPEPFVPVLVLMPDEKPHPIVREGHVTRKGKWRAGLYERDPDEITHWMPMPKP